MQASPRSRAAQSSLKRARLGLTCRSLMITSESGHTSAQPLLTLPIRPTAPSTGTATTPVPGSMDTFPQNQKGNSIILLIRLRKPSAKKIESSYAELQIAFYAAMPRPAKT